MMFAAYGKREANISCMTENDALMNFINRKKIFVYNIAKPDASDRSRAFKRKLIFEKLRGILLTMGYCEKLLKIRKISKL